MDFKSLCQETARLCEMTATIQSVTTATGQLADAVRWTARAWTRIQLMRGDWEFMRKRLSFQTVAGQQAYTPAQMSAADLASIDARSVSCYETAIGRNDEQPMDQWAQEDLEEVYDFATTTSHRPIVWAMRSSDRSMLLGATPDKVYTIRGWYRSKAQQLAADDDVPIIDDDLHLVIPHYAAVTYANLEAAPEIKIELGEALSDYMAAMKRRYLTELTFEGPLA